MTFVCLFTLYWVSPCLVLTMTCTTNKRIIVIPWTVKAVTASKAPPFLTAHYTGVGWMFTMSCCLSCVLTVKWANVTFVCPTVSCVLHVKCSTGVSCVPAIVRLLYTLGNRVRGQTWPFTTWGKFNDISNCNLIIVADISPSLEAIKLNHGFTFKY